MKAALISIGDEILLGDVLDTNAHFIAGGLTKLGVRVHRMHTIPDSLDEIAKSLDYAINNGRMDIVVTTGGLGPTVDDKTYEAVAQFLGVDIYEDPRALLYLEERVELLNVIDTSRVRTLIPARRKMASIPRGGIPLFNPQGAAPGLWYERDGRVLICLPGVPIEMTSIWEVEARPRLMEFTSGYAYEEMHFIVRYSDESMLAPIVADAGARFPEVHFKTRPKRAGFGWEIKLDIAQFTSGECPSLLSKAVEHIKGALDREGIELDVRGGD
jgi:nicotinamide-nucleotide amidase